MLSTLIVAASSLAMVQATTALAPGRHCYYDPAIGGWTVDAYLSADLPSTMGVSSAALLKSAPDFPLSFQGMWWLNNTEPTGLLSINGNDAVQISPLEFKFPAFFHGYGYDNTDSGLLSWVETFYENFYIHLVFTDTNYNFARINQRFYGIPAPAFADTFDIYQVDQDTWTRNSTMLGFDVSQGDYTVRRVVEADGTELPMFQQWLDFNRERTGSDYSLFGTARDGKTWAKMCL